MPNNPKIRACATVRFREPVPTGFILSTDESFTISINGVEYSIDFLDAELGFKDGDRQVVEVEFKNPDYATFPDVFEALTLDAILHKEIKLVGNLDDTVIASNPVNDDYIIGIEKIEELYLSSPNNDFPDKSLI